MCTRRALCAAALLTSLLTAAFDLYVDDEDDDESDSSSFMIILEHANGWQCAASLVSTRTAVTTARCARGEGTAGGPWARGGATAGRVWAHGDATAGGPWALAAALLRVRAPAPPAAAARRVTRVALAGDSGETDLALDMAVIELEAPFGREAQARPVIMSTTRNGGEGATMCHAIRAVAALSPSLATVSGGAKRARFHVVNVKLASENHCAPVVPHWSASRARLLCFAGEDLCERDMGGGVVCDGKLCAVLSVMATSAGAARCEKTYAAQNIARWRSFLHCAHTLRICGRGACSGVCTDYLLDETNDSTTMAQIDTTRLTEHSAPITVSQASRTAASAFDSNPPLEVVNDHVSLPSIEFEPNRADFKAAPSRTSRPGLKAGEYGDNAAEYGADEAAPPQRSSAAGPPGPPGPPTRTAAPPSAPPARPIAPPALRNVPVISESTASAPSIFCDVSAFRLFISVLFFSLI